MTARFCTGRRIISSVINQCAEAAAKGLTSDLLSSPEQNAHLRKPERVIFFGLTLLLQGCLLRRNEHVNGSGLYI